jgi:ABC-type uncharacterized transport system ATPase subunit
VHALLGENGAGKSTLVKCIMGYHRPDEGDLLVWGRERTFTNPREAHALSLGMVYQHFTLVPNMTVAENLLLARPALPAVMRWSQESQHSKRSWRRCLAKLTSVPGSIPWLQGRSKKSNCSSSSTSTGSC